MPPLSPSRMRLCARSPIEVPGQPARRTRRSSSITSSAAPQHSAAFVKLARAGFYQLRLPGGRDAVLGVNPDRRESNLEPMGEDVQQLWSGSSGTGEAAKAAEGAPVNMENPEKYRSVSLWWYVMLLVLLAAVAESVVASHYLGTQREEA